MGLSYRHVVKVHSVNACQEGDGGEDGGDYGEDEEDAILPLRPHRLDEVVHVVASIRTVLDVIHELEVTAIPLSHLLQVVFHVVQVHGNSP